MSKKSLRRLLIAAAALVFAIQAAGNTGIVRKVHSGDLVQFGDSFIARLTGIKAPPRNESLGYEIYDFTKKELEGQTVKLFTWTMDNTAAGIVHDDAGYPFVQIFYGKGASVSFNEVMLNKGYARVDPKYLPDDLKHYLDLEKEAREKGLGIWKARERASGGKTGDSRGRPDPFPAVKEEIIRSVEGKKIPSLSLAVVRNGEIIWEEAFGLASIGKKAEATRETLYPIASATKPFTATAIMILVERGLVDLDRPAVAYLGKVGLRSLAGDAPEATVRRILHHTAGLPMYWSFYYAGSSRRRPPLETTLERYACLVSRPGESYNYSNLGYAILERIIEQVSGKPYPEFLADEIFKPLALSHASVCLAPPASADVAEKYSSTLALVPFCDHDTRGASAIYATAHDLALFLLLHLGRLQPGQKAILKPDSVAAMQKSRDPDVRDSSYALGWETGTRFGYPVVTHGGGMDGCRAHLAMIPSEGLAAAVLINGENVPSIQVCDSIFAALLPKYAAALRSVARGGPSPSPPAKFRPTAELVGTWTGMIRTHEEDIPARLVVDSAGEVKLQRPDQAGKIFSPLKMPTVNRGLFIVHFPQVFSTSDTLSAGHRTILAMKIRKERLAGEANTIAPDMSYSFPSLIELKRQEQRLPR